MLVNIPTVGLVYVNPLLLEQSTKSNVVVM